MLSANDVQIETQQCSQSFLFPSSCPSLYTLHNNSKAVMKPVGCEVRWIFVCNVCEGKSPLSLYDLCDTHAVDERESQPEIRHTKEVVTRD